MEPGKSLASASGNHTAIIKKLIIEMIRSRANPNHIVSGLGLYFNLLKFGFLLSFAGIVILSWVFFELLADQFGVLSAGIVIGVLSLLTGLIVIIQLNKVANR